MRIRLSNNSGLTLVELLLSLGLLSAVLPTLLLVFSAANLLYEKQQVDADLQYSCRCALYWIMEDIRTGQGFEILENGEKLIIIGEKESIQYYVQNNNLYRQSITKMPVTEIISSIFYQQLSPQTLQITIESNIGEHIYILTTRCGIRNQEICIM